MFKSKSWINACGLMAWWLPYRAILSNIISWSKISISNDMLSCILGKMWFAYIYGAYRASSMVQWVKKICLQCRRHRRHGFDPGLGRSPEGGNGNPLQCSCLENPMDPALSNAEPELLTSPLFSLISLFMHSFIYSIVHSCMHQAFSESLWWARNCVRYRQRELEKNTLHELHELTVGKTDEQWPYTVQWKPW